MDITYTIPSPLTQEIVNYLNARPAVETRHILNQLEALCTSQDAARVNASAPADVAPPPAPADVAPPTHALDGDRKVAIKANRRRR